MDVLALIAFGILIVAWTILPAARAPKVEVHTPVEVAAAAD